MCNTLYHIAFGTKSTFFEPSSQPQSFTKGLWLLSPEARMELPGIPCQMKKIVSIRLIGKSHLDR